jgi:hypothetical protein
MKIYEFKKLIREEVRKILNESKPLAGEFLWIEIGVNPDLKKIASVLDPNVIIKIDNTIEKLYSAREDKIANGQAPAQSYYSGVNRLQSFIVAELKKKGVNAIEGEGDDNGIEINCYD